MAQVAASTGLRGSTLEQPTSERDWSFAQLAEEWRRDTALCSSPTEIAMHPAYQRIIGMGPPVIGLVLLELRNRPGQWFWALKALTGEDPVPPESRGDIEAMTLAWLLWGRARGYL